MSTTANKQLVRRYYETIVSTGRVDDIRDFVSSDYVEVHDKKRYAIGIQGAISHIHGVRATYPDLQLTVKQQIAEGDWVVGGRIVEHGGAANLLQSFLEIGAVEIVTGKDE